MLEWNETSLQQTCRKMERGKTRQSYIYSLLYMYLQFLRNPYDWMYIVCSNWRDALRKRSEWIAWKVGDQYDLLYYIPASFYLCCVDVSVETNWLIFNPDITTHWISEKITWYDDFNGYKNTPYIFCCCLLGAWPFLSSGWWAEPLKYAV